MICTSMTRGGISGTVTRQRPSAAPGSASVAASATSRATLFPKRPLPRAETGGAMTWCAGASLPSLIGGAVLLLTLAMGSTRGYAADESRTFRAGAYAMDITPTSFPIGSAGSMSPREATMAHDPLHARCLVLDDGETKVAFAVCDHCMIPRELVDRARQRAAELTDIPAENILCAATHTHTGVTLAPAFQSEVETEYCEMLVEKIAEGIAKANEQLAPARVGWTLGHNPNQVFNRRWYMRDGFEITDPFETGTDRVRMNPPAGNSKLLQPSGPADPEIPIISLIAPDGKPIALLANYSLHYVGGVPGGALSADYFGEFAQQYARLAGIGDASSFVAIMTNGTSGNINNVNFFRAAGARQEPFEQIRLVARDVAESVVEALRRIEYHDWVPLKSVEEEIELGVRKPSADDLERARRLIREAGPGPYGDVRLVYAKETIELAEYPDRVPVRIQAIRVGDLGIVSSPCETFVETGLAIKRDSALRPTFTIELANGYNGYLPTPEQHALGGYETWRAKSSYLAVDAEPVVRETQLRLLKALDQ